MYSSSTIPSINCSKHLIRQYIYRQSYSLHSILVMTADRLITGKLLHKLIVTKASRPIARPIASKNCIEILYDEILRCIYNLARVNLGNT